MDDDVAIKVSGVSKKFSRNLKSLMKYGFYDIGRNILGMSVDSGKLRNGEFWAVDDVSFELKKGEGLGIIGKNGSGKSTMLKMLNGIYMPDKGTIQINGKVSALIEVGAGFHPMLTGRENIYVNGAILGMSKKEIDEKFDEIVAFADIGDFLDSPVRNYSSGMYVRLGFAIAVHTTPDILIIDEILAVGDINFQSKCFNKMGEMRKNGVTTIFVSHSNANILGFCEKVMYLYQGREKYNGNVEKGIELYQEDLLVEESKSHLGFDDNNVIGTGLVHFTKIEFLDEYERHVDEIDAEELLILRLHHISEQYIGHAELDIAIRDNKGQTYFRASSNISQKKIIIGEGENYIDVILKGLHANDQKLLFYVTLWNEGRSELFDWKRELPLIVKGNSLTGGIVLLDIDWVAKKRG